MKHQVLLFLGIFFFSYTSGITQNNDEASPQELVFANVFIDSLKAILNQERADDFVPELIATKDELRAFLDYEWKRRYSRRMRAKLEQEFGSPTERFWEIINKDEGFNIAMPLIGNKNMITDEKKVRRAFVNASFSDVNVNISETYDRDFGEISKLKIYIITTMLITNSNPIYEYKISFPCILTAENKFKIVGGLKGELISTELQKD